MKQLPIIWTAGAIATFLRVSPDFVYNLAREPGTPIRKRGNRLYALQDELEAWMRRPTNHASLKEPKTA